MKLQNSFSQKTAFHIAVEKGNKAIVKLLLNCDRIDVNMSCIYNVFQ